MICTSSRCRRCTDRDFDVYSNKMSVRQSQAAWLDTALNPSLMEMRIARTRVDRLARENNELKHRVQYQTEQIIHLNHRIERLQKLSFMLAYILRLPS